MANRQGGADLRRRLPSGQSAEIEILMNTHMHCGFGASAIPQLAAPADQVGASLDVQPIPEQRWLLAQFAKRRP